MAKFLKVLQGMDKGDKVTVEFDKEDEGFAKLVLYDESAQSKVTRDIVFINLEKGTFAYGDSDDEEWNGLLEDVRKLGGVEPEIKTGITPKEEEKMTDPSATTWELTNKLIGMFQEFGDMSDTTLTFPIDNREELALVLAHGDLAFELYTKNSTVNEKNFYITGGLAERIGRTVRPSSYSFASAVNALQDVVKERECRKSLKLLENYVMHDTVNAIDPEFLQEVLAITGDLDTSEEVYRIYTAETYRKLANEQWDEETLHSLAEDLATIIYNYSVTFIASLLTEEATWKGKEATVFFMDGDTLDVFDILLVHIAKPLLVSVGLSDVMDEVLDLASNEVYEMYQYVTSNEEDLMLSEEEIQSIVDNCDAFDDEDSVSEEALKEEEQAKFENEHAQELEDLGVRLAVSKSLVETAEAILDEVEHVQTDTTAYRMAKFAVGKGKHLLDKIDYTPVNEQALEYANSTLDLFNEEVEPDLNALALASSLEEATADKAVLDTLKRVLANMEFDLESVTKRQDHLQVIYYEGSIKMLTGLIKRINDENRVYGMLRSLRMLGIYLIRSIEVSYDKHGYSSCDFEIKVTPDNRERETTKAILNFLQGLLNSIEDKEDEKEEVEVVVEEDKPLVAEVEVEDDEEEVADSKVKPTMDEAKLLADWQNGVPLYELTDKYGISVGAIYSILYANGAEVKSSKVAERVAHVESDPAKLAEVLRAYKVGVRLASIYEKYDLHKNGLFYLLDKYRVPRRGRTKK